MKTLWDDGLANASGLTSIEELGRSWCSRRRS